MNMKTTTTDLTIREENPRDYPAVYDVNIKAFGGKNEAQLVDRLRGCHYFVPQLSLVATIGHKVVGHVLFSEISIINDALTTPCLALAPIAVLPPYQRQGIGSQLIETGLNKAKQLGYKSVIVLGHENYYPRFGFVPTARWNIKPPFAVPQNVFMGKELFDGALANVSGTVFYPKEFEEM